MLLLFLAVDAGLLALGHADRASSGGPGAVVFWLLVDLLLLRAVYRGSGAARVTLLVLVLVPLAQVLGSASWNVPSLVLAVGLLVQVGILLSPAVAGLRRPAAAPVPVGQR